MTVAESTAGNPLRDPLDRRLPRIPEPCALVIFGVTGDLARKKLLPAIYDLANRGLLPPGFVVLGFARRDWGDGDFESMAQRGGPGPRPHARGGTRCGPGCPAASSSCPARSTTTPRSTTWPAPSTSCATRHGIHGNAAFYLSIPPAGVPGGAQADAAHRHGRQRRSPAAGGGSWWRSRSAPT